MVVSQGYHAGAEFLRKPRVPQWMRAWIYLSPPPDTCVSPTRKTIKGMSLLHASLNLVLNSYVRGGFPDLPLLLMDLALFCSLCFIL